LIALLTSAIVVIHGSTHRPDLDHADWSRTSPFVLLCVWRNNGAMDIVRRRTDLFGCGVAA
jgi:hypothetical protein